MSGMWIRVPETGAAQVPGPMSRLQGGIDLRPVLPHRPSLAGGLLPVSVQDDVQRRRFSRTAPISASISSEEILSVPCSTDRR